MFSYEKSYFLYNLKKNKLNHKIKKLKERKHVSPENRCISKSPHSRLYSNRRISFCLFSKRKRKASMTVEASLALPVFLFAFLNLLSVIEIYRFQSNLSMAMHTTVKEMAVYGHAYSQMREDPNRLESYGLTYLYGAGRVKSCLPDDYLARIPVKDKYAGIDWTKSDMSTNRCIDLVATYHAKSMVGAVGKFEIPMYCRMYTKIWNGYEIPLVKNQENTEKIVYVTPDGEAYHTTKSCSYLRLSIRAVDKRSVGKLRNQDGSIYYPCSLCGNKNNNTVFITLYGTNYHSTMGCSGLKRTIHAVPLSQVGGRHQCSKCGKE